MRFAHMFENEQRHPAGDDMFEDDHAFGYGEHRRGIWRDRLFSVDELGSHDGDESMELGADANLFDQQPQAGSMYTMAMRTDREF
mmetsp:Transcript_21503/g.28814  ORF Transcript_21503/g.28814 Transcript_21503/m.28814 type:complete len:85 (-) Transcript_21503:744-998(-)